MERKPSKRIIIGLLADGVPRGIHQIHLETGLGKRAVEGACYRAWRGGNLLRSSEPVYGRLSRFRGRAGTISTNRGYYLYWFRGDGQDSARVGDVEYVPYGEEFLSGKIPKGESKSKRILRFLKENPERAWYSTEIVDSLKDEGVRSVNVMPAVRRYTEKGFLFIRGYRTETRLKPFSKGFLIT